MKRLLALLMLLSLCVLTACGGNRVPTSSDSYGSASLESGIDVTVKSQPPETPVTYAVETTVYGDSTFADDGTELAEYHYELPTLKVYREDGSEITEADGPSEEKALTVTAAFGAQFDAWAQATGFADMASIAKDDYTLRMQNQGEWYGCYDEELTYAAYQTEHLISIAAVCYSYTGGAHPNHTELGWIFDLDTGSFISPASLAMDGQSFQEAVTAEIIRQAKIVAQSYQMDPAEYFLGNYESVVADWPSYAVSFNENGMTVSFSPYELACYAAGSQTFTIGYDFLLPYLSDEGLTLLGLAPETAPEQ